jgi:uncharacterized membrane protein
MTQRLRASFGDRKFLATLIVLLIAGGLRIVELDARSLWLDEGMEYWVATSSIENIAEAVRVGIQDPPLYSLLLHFWMELGQSEFHMRFLSVLFSLGSVAGIMLLGFRMSGFPSGLAAGMIMAILPSQIRYAQEVGQYALMGCLLVWSLIALQRLSVRESWSNYLLWAVLVIAATYSYYGAAICALTPAIVVLAGKLNTRDWKGTSRMLLAVAACALAIAPLILYFLPSQILTTQVLRTPLESPVEELRTLWDSTLHMIAFQFTGWPWTYVPLWLSPGLVALLLLFSIRRRGAKESLFLWLLSVWVVYYLVGRLGLFPYGFRYGLILTPLLIPAITLVLSNPLITKSLEQKSSVLLILCILAAGAISLPNRSLRDGLSRGANWAWPETEDMRPVVEYWLENRRSTDSTYVYYGAAPAFAYYLGIYGQDDTLLPPNWYIHCWRGESKDYCHDNNIYYGEWIRSLDQAEKTSSIRRAIPSSAERVWVVFSHIYSGEDDVILGNLQENYGVVLAFETNNASGYLLKELFPQP